MEDRKKLTEAVIKILEEMSFTSQKEIVDELTLKGFKGVNQSKVSRLIRKLGAVRIRNSLGNIVYRLPLEMSLPDSQSQVLYLVHSVENNGMVIIVKTSAGAAPLISRMIDTLPYQDHILGVISGDDTIAVYAKKNVNIDYLTLEICDALKCNSVPF